MKHGTTEQKEFETVLTSGTTLTLADENVSTDGTGKKLP